MVNAIPSPLVPRSELLRQLGGLSRSASYEWEKNDPDFPKPVALGSRRVVFVQSEINAYVEKLKAARQGGAA